MTDRLLALDAVKDQVGFKHTKIYALIKEGRFPAPVKIDSASRWKESEINDWIAAQSSEA